MLIKLHGRFAQDYGPEYSIEADTVAEAIEGFSRQVGFYADLFIEDRPIARVPGFDTVDSLAQKTEQNEIHLVPAMIGGGGNVGKILIGAALIATAVAIPGIGAAIGVKFASAVVGKAVVGGLMASGIGMVLGGVMGIFMGAPSVSKAKDPEASKYLGISDNTVNIGTVIPIQYGRGPATGHVLAVNVDSSEMLTGTFPATPT